MSELTYRIIDILLPLVVALLGGALALGAAYLKRQTAAIANEEIREFVFDAVDRGRSAVYKAVQATEQTYVADLKSAHEDGKLTADEAAEARRRAQQHFARILGQQGIVELGEAVGDVQRWFESHLEAVVSDLKAG